MDHQIYDSGDQVAMQVEGGSFAVCLLLCGLPGSGKSTFVRDITGAAAGLGNSGQQQDDTLKVLSSKFDQIDSIEYDKVARHELDQQQHSNGEEAEEFESSDLDAWRKSRTKALEILTRKLGAHFTADDSHSGSLLVILDDNFHLRSMRRDVYRTCQNVVKQRCELDGRIPTIGFCVVYFDTPLETCLERNSSRIGKEFIPDDVVVRMAASIEPPDENKPNASFERCHVTFDNSSGGQVGRYNGVIRCIHESTDNPVRPKSELSPEEQEQKKQDLLREREATRKNMTQQSDLLLRRLVGAVGRVEKNRSKDANATRKSIMDDIKCGDKIGDLSLERIALRFASAVTGNNKLNHWSDSDETPLIKAIHSSFHEFQDSRR